MFAAAGAAAYAAEPVKAAGETTAKEAGRSDDPASAEKKTKDGKRNVKAAGAHDETAGRANDPCAAGQGTAAGGDVKRDPRWPPKSPAVRVTQRPPRRRSDAVTGYPVPGSQAPRSIRASTAAPHLTQLPIVRLTAHPGLIGTDGAGYCATIRGPRVRYE